MMHLHLHLPTVTNWRAVVYLDADVIVMRNIDVLFTCPGFCAALRHSERLNSGVMALTPSTALYEDMMSKIQTFPSYTGCAWQSRGWPGCALASWRSHCAARFSWT